MRGRADRILDPLGGDVATYAIVETGGKQYRVVEGDTIRVESLPGDEGDAIDLDQVLMVSKEGKVSLGSPIVKNATVSTYIEKHGRDKKIVVFKYKSKVRYRKKTGHRQNYTDLTITDIKTSTRRRKKKDGA